MMTDRTSYSFSRGIIRWGDVKTTNVALKNVAGIQREEVKEEKNRTCCRNQ